jgi:hypothetical protein
VDVDADTEWTDEPAAEVTPSPVPASKPRREKPAPKATPAADLAPRAPRTKQPEPVADLVPSEPAAEWSTPAELTPPVIEPQSLRRHPRPPAPQPSAATSELRDREQEIRERIEAKRAQLEQLFSGATRD